MFWARRSDVDRCFESVRSSLSKWDLSNATDASDELPHKKLENIIVVTKLNRNLFKITLRGAKDALAWSSWFKINVIFPCQKITLFLKLLTNLLLFITSAQTLIFFLFKALWTYFHCPLCQRKWCRCRAYWLCIIINQTDDTSWVNSRDKCRS